MFSSEEIDDNLLFTPAGIFCVTLGGWLLDLFTYSGTLFGLMNGLKLSFSRSRITSRKSTHFRLASAVILSPNSENTAQIFFFRGEGPS